MKISEMQTALADKPIALKLLNDYLRGGTRNPNDFYKFLEEYRQEKYGGTRKNKKSEWLKNILHETNGKVAKAEYDKTMKAHIFSIQMPDGEIEQFKWKNK